MSAQMGARNTVTLATARRVLVLTTSWPRTLDPIAGTFVRTDAIHRTRDGSRVIVAAPAGPGVARAAPDVRVLDLPHGALFGSPGAIERLLAAPWRLLGLLPFNRAARAVLRDAHVRHVVAHWLVPAAPLACAFARRDDVTLELIAHGGDVRLLEAIPRPIARRFLEALADRATTLRVVSSSLAERLARLAPTWGARMVVAPMPLATDDPATLALVRRRGRAIRARFQRSLHVVASRLVAAKRIERAIDALSPADGPLALVGDGPARNGLIDRARARGLDVHAPGAVDHEDALAWIAAADTVLAPLAHGEGAPTVVREARALGTHVVEIPATLRRMVEWGAAVSIALGLAACTTREERACEQRVELWARYRRDERPGASGRAPDGAATNAARAACLRVMDTIKSGPKSCAENCYSVAGTFGAIVDCDRKCGVPLPVE